MDFGKFLNDLGRTLFGGGAKKKKDERQAPAPRQLPTNRRPAVNSTRLNNFAGTVELDPRKAESTDKEAKKEEKPDVKIQGGVKIAPPKLLADAGKAFVDYQKQGVDLFVKPVIDDAVTAKQQTELAIRSRLNGDNGIGGTKALDPLRKQYENDLKQGKITQAQYDEVAGKIKIRGTKNEVAQKKAEDAVGVKMDQNKGTIAALSTIANASGVEALPKLAVNALAKPGARMVKGTAGSILDGVKSLTDDVIERLPKSNSPIKPAGTAPKAPAITSANPNFVKPDPAAMAPPVPEAPLAGVMPTKGPVAVAPEPPMVQPTVMPAGVAPTPAPVVETPLPNYELGTITRQSVLNGGIDDVDEVNRIVTTTANEAAEGTGTTLDDIIRKGQKVWQESNKRNKDFTTKEASEYFDGAFTPEQQDVYKRYAQEIGTLRDRSGLSLDGGNQGAWYGPRQSLDEAGNSVEFNPELVNEIKRNKDQAKAGVDDRNLDVSEVPYEQAIKRYADAPDASTRLITDAAEKNLKTGEATGVTITEPAKAKFTESMKSVVAKRDEALKKEAAGDIKGANKLKQEVQKDINKAFDKFMDDIPKGAGREAAFANLKDMRGAYMQSTMQTLSLSNIVNRVADQGTRLVYGAQQPLVRGLNKVINPLMKGQKMEGTTALELNTTREAGKAANKVARGTLRREITDNFKTNMTMAGAGRNPVTKIAAKAEALPRAVATAMTQAGDLSTQNVKKALQLGASRPEAAKLKTVDDYKKYFADYVNTEKFQDDITKVQAMNNPRIGLAGTKGDNMVGGGPVSGFLSKYVDNAVSTVAEKVAGKGNNRVVREANDYVKGNITGYAGVGSRVMSTVGNAGAFGVPRIVKAVKVAKSGDPTAIASATQIASQSVADAIALYGSAAAAAAAIGKTDVLGFTGAQPVQGSSEAAYRNANNIPANQWYLNIGGERVYFDPSRPLGAPGVGMNIAASVAGGDNPADTAANAGGQILSQAGGTNLPENFENARKGFFDSSQQQGSKEFYQDKVAAMLAPSTGFLNNIANATDDKRRQAKGFIDNIKANVPILRGQVAEAKDARGNTIPNSRQASGGSGLYSVGKNTDAPKTAEEAAKDPLGDEINRLQKKDGNVFPTNSNTNAKDRTTTEMSKILLGTKMYSGADDKTKAALLNEALSGTKLKDIHPSVGEADKAALIEYKLMDSDKRKVWLEDNNDNAAAYRTADYNNAKARGALSKDDENLESKTGRKYRMLAAQVNQKYGVTRELQLAYEDTSETEWRSMIDPDSDDYDPEKAQLLFDYDKARTEAGVSQKSSTSSKPKFTEKVSKAKGSGSGRRSGSGGGGSSGNFAFASLPGSLIGSAANGKYAEDAPTFKPIADLQAPRSEPIPKGRTISVKKGIVI